MTTDKDGTNAGLVKALRKELWDARRIISATHKNPVVHTNCEVHNCPICDGGLFQCADCGAAEIETETRVCSAALQAPQEAGVLSEAAELDKREAFKAGWWTNAACEQPADYLTDCEEVDWSEYKKAHGLDAYVQSIIKAGREAKDELGFAALQAPQEAGVSVKALEWRDERNCECSAETPVGMYEVGFDDGWWAHLEGGVKWDWQPELDRRSYCGPEAAKAAAQADFEKRIRSALSQPVATPAPSQDAQQWRVHKEPVRDARHALELLDDVDSLVRFCSVSMPDVERYYRGSEAMWRVAEWIAARRRAPSQDAAVETLVEIVREHLEIDGDGEGPFIRLDSIENAVRAALAATRPAEAQAVAEGWKLVPVDPTEAMCVAGCREDDILGELVDWRGPDTTTREVVANLYRTMLAASPATGGA